MWSKEEVESFNIRMERIIDILDWAEEKGRISYSDFEECALMLSCFIHQFVPAQDSSRTEPVSEDLKQAIHNAIFALDERKGYTFKLEDMFMAGAQWQKQQMMNDAVDAEVVAFQNGCALFANMVIDGMFYGDKVKLIIIKED